MKDNQYPDNPHEPGTFYAAQWDFAVALRSFGATVLAQIPWYRDRSPVREWIAENRREVQT